jgi:hypothetical protein
MQQQCGTASRGSLRIVTMGWDKVVLRMIKDWADRRMVVREICDKTGLAALPWVMEQSLQF